MEDCRRVVFRAFIPSDGNTTRLVVLAGGEWGGEGSEVAGIGEPEVFNGDMYLLPTVVNVAGWMLLLV